MRCTSLKMSPKRAAARTAIRGAAKFAGELGCFPPAELASQEILALPLYPELTGAQQEIVVRAIEIFIALSFTLCGACARDLPD
jgi:dTDP-4-amino-4,6-dideoxygalactose transaminase